MSECYLIWYRLENENIDRVRGMALNWPRAERMAENLEIHLRVVEKLPVTSVGVKRASHGTIYDNEELSLRWSVIPPEQKER